MTGEPFKEANIAQNRAIARALIRRYAVALLLVAASSTAAWFSLRLVIAEQQSTAAIVNVSGRQRMLSQRTALFANLLVMTPPAGRPAIRASLQDAVDLMERSHRALTLGDPAMGLPANHSPTVEAMYFAGADGVDAQVNRYVAAVRQLLELSDDALTTNHPLLLQITRTAPTTLVSALDGMVKQYQAEGEANVRRIEATETAVWLLTLALLVLEAGLIFQPFASHIKRVVGKLQLLTDELQHHRDHLEELVRQRTTELQNKSAELAESMEKFRLISSAAQDAIVIIGRNAEVVHWNLAAERIFGYTETEALGRNLHELIVPLPMRELAHAGYRTFESTGQGIMIGKTLQTMSLRKNGDEFPIELSVSAIKLQNNWHALSIIRDVTQRKGDEDSLRSSEEQLRFVLEGAELGYWDWNISTGEVIRNSRWAEMLGYSHEEIRHTTQQWSDFVHPDDRAAAWQSIRDVIEGRSPSHKLEYRMLHKDGSILWVLDQAKVMQRDVAGKPVRMSGTHSDITERKRLEAELTRQARTDYLTGISSRGYFLEQAEQELASALRYGNPLTMLMMDVDFFKQVNDIHGHRAGDAVLKKLADVCRETLREADIIGRLGGEEFAILLPQTDKGSAVEAAERLKEVLGTAQVPHDGGKPLSFTVSIGAAALTGGDDSVDALLNRADQALYRAKESGRNRVCAAVD
ncbi:diguanylate cyclase [Methylomonas sp. HW2-6]|uniref:diguanylate cyclase n=1 Tax=Methylomonas sp. HW2-6 TaxID=3376687 RepID=UPI0040416BC8